MPDKNLRDEINGLTEAVRELKDREVADTLRELRAEVEKLRAERATHHCTGCTCTHIHWYTTQPLISPCAPYVQPQIWYGTVTSGSVGINTVTTTGSGYNPAVTTVSYSN